MANQYKENIGVCEQLFSDTVEQSLELDYMLPDYYPAIFKILKGCLCPVLNSWRISGNKLVIEGTAYLKVLYLNEDDGGIRMLEQKQPFVKTVELKEDATGGKAELSARCSYFNCRAVSPRRLDLRGAVSIRVTVTRPKMVPVLTEDEGLQMRKQQITCCSSQNTVAKEISLSEQMSIGAGNPSIRDVLRYEAHAVLQEVKVLAGKIVCKGEVRLHTLYLPNGEGAQPEHLEQILPISQIIDFLGLEEEDQASAFAEVLRYDLDLQLEEDGECHSFTVGIGVRITCMAAKNRSIVVVDDCYSTKYETQLQMEQLPLEELLCAVREEPVVKESVKLRGELNAVFDLIPTIQAVSWEVRESVLWLCGNLQLSVLAADLEGLPICLEQTMAFEFPLKDQVNSTSLRFAPMVQVSRMDYQILSSSELEVRAEMLVNGMLYQVQSCSALTEVVVQEDCPKQRDGRMALRLYFADAGETVWGIAKRYNTSVEAILGQNELQSDAVSGREMLLIPLID